MTSSFALLVSPPPVARPPSPEQLDQALAVTPSLLRAAVLGLVGLLIAGLVWGVLSTAPVKVKADGILLNPTGVGDVVTPAAGRLNRLLAVPGERITAGQPIARLDQPEDAAELSRKRAEQAKLLDRQRRIGRFLETEGGERRTLATARDAGLAARIAALTALERTMDDMVGVQEDLNKRGLSTRDRFLASQRQLHEVRSQRTEAENERVKIAADARAEAIRDDRERLDVEMQLAAIARDIAWAETELERRSTVKAPDDGLIVEQVLNIGEMATVGGALLRFLPGDGKDRLRALLYVPPAEARRVRLGMAAQVVPSSVREHRDGFVHGRVVEVSHIAATPESLMRTLKNSKIVEQLLSGGAPEQVVVELDTDPTTPSGLRWSNGDGPPLPLSNGVMAKGRIVTDTIPLIALVAPRAEQLLSRLGL